MLNSLMYHYVMAPGDMFPNRKGCTTDEFDKHVRIISSNNTVYDGTVLRSEAARHQLNDSERAFVFTFDDGLAEHFWNVAPILESYNCRGFFFIPTSIFDGRLLKVHKLHIVLSVFGTQIFEFIREKLDVTGIELPELCDDAVRRVYRWDDIEVARAKYIINYVVDHELGDAILSGIFEERIGSEKEIAKKFYMSKDQMIALRDRGHVIGGHSHRHVPLTSLGQVAETDITTCLQSLRSVVGNVDFFSFPYGKKTTYSDAHIAQLKHEGMTNVFTTEVGAGYLGSDGFALRRTDPKDHF